MRLTASIALGLSAASTLVMSPLARPIAAQSRDTVGGPVLTLEEATRIALRSNPDYLLTVASRRTAAAQLRTSYGQLLPQASANFSSQYQQAGTQTVQGASFNVASDIYQSSYNVGVTYRLNGQTIMGPRVQRANMNAVEADIVGVRETTRSIVAQLYISVLQNQAQAALQDSLVRLNDTQLRLAQAKLQVGSGTSLDVTRAEVDLGTQRVASLRAHNTVETSKLQLFQAMGVMQPTNVQLTSTFVVKEPTFSLDSILGLAMRLNPAVQALQARETAAAVSVKSARSEYFPSLFLQTGLGGYTYQLADPSGQIQLSQFQKVQQQASCFTTDSIRRGAGLPSIASQCAGIVYTPAQAAAFRAANKQFPFNFTKQPLSLFAQLSLPIFNGFQREQDVQIAQAQRDDALYNTRKGQLRVQTDVTTAYLTLRTAARAVALQEQTEQRAKEELRLAEERFRVGAGTSLDVTQATTSYERAATDHITAIYDFHKAFAVLESAVGRPLR